MDLGDANAMFFNSKILILKSIYIYIEFGLTMSITYRFFGVAIQNSKGPALSVHQNLFKLPAPLEQAGLTYRCHPEKNPFIQGFHDIPCLMTHDTIIPRVETH